VPPIRLATVSLVIAAGRLLTFAAAAFALIVIPGPSVLFVVGRGMALGRRAALATVVGNAAGEYTQIVLVALGAGAVLARSVAVFTVLKLAGAAYLVLLGVRAIRRRHSLAHVVDAATEPRSALRIVREGFVVGVSNPKSLVFFAAILPQFVDQSRGHAAVQMLVLGLIFVGIALVSDSAWGMAAGTARLWLSRSPRRLAAIGGASGAVMIGLGLGLAFTGRKD
jgi:threonine/homoserine/homoserine lactone efflux protein